MSDRDPGSAQTRLFEARKQCQLARDRLERDDEFALCADVAEIEAAIEDVLETVETHSDCDEERSEKVVADV